MRNKFLKMTFMALCLSTSSALHAMNPEDEVASCSSAISPYVGEYEIRRNDPYEQSSGSVTIRQDGDSLILENFSLIPGSYYHNLLEKTIEDIEQTFNDTKQLVMFKTEGLRIVNFVLSALPTEVISLKFLRGDNGIDNYGAKITFGELHESWTKIEDRTPDLFVYFRIQRYLGKQYFLDVLSSFGSCGFTPSYECRLFKVESAEYDSLLERSMLFSSSHTASMPSSDPLLLPSSSGGSRGLVKTTFRTAGANETAEIKHSAIYASFSYQNNPDAAYSLIINHRTKDDKGSIVRVHNPNARAYINLGRLSPSVSFSNEVFDLSSLFEGAPSSSSSASIMRTELNFTDGISDIHSFKIKSDGKTLIKVALGDEGSEKQTGVYVYAPELSGKLQEWSEVRFEDVQS